jgi:hypothetical protein
MMEVFLLQFLAAGLGAASTALADCFYRSALIGQRIHSLWISTSIAVICLPVVVWACDVFLGLGIFGTTVAGIVGGVVFFWVYQNLRKEPPLHRFSRPGSPPHPASATVLPSKLNR